MDEEFKNTLMRIVTRGGFSYLKIKFNEHKLIQDETYFDYELLKAALKRKHISISNFLLNQGCRVRNLNKVNSEETALHLAMKINNTNIVRKILKKGACISDKNHNGETALYTAFKGGCKNAVDTALTHICIINNKQLKTGIDFNLNYINPKDKDDILHFHIACISNHYDAVNLYLRHGFDVNSPISLNSAEFSGLNPLHYVASKGDRNMFESLLKQGGDLSIKNSNGQTPLQIIFYCNTDTDMIESAFKIGNYTKFINSVDNNGVSHFHLCCAINYPDLVKVFINKGVDINSSISLSCSVFPGYTPLHFAVKNDCEEVVELLLESGADCNKVDKERLSPLKMAFYTLPNGKKSILDKLILKIPREVNFTDDKGLSNYHIVCTRNNISQIHDFLRSGVAVDSCVVSGKYSGYTALHFAVLYNQKDVVEVLLKQNAQVNIKTNKFQVTSLHLACNYNHHSIQLHEMTTYDRSINLDYTSNSKSHLDIIKLLIQYGADVDAQDSSGATPLIYACTIDKNKLYSDYLNKELIERTKEIIEILLLNKANVNARTNRQESILHIISEKYFPNIPELVEYLISKGADVHAVDDDGLTPLHVAVKSSKKEVVQILLKYKANVNAKSKDSLIPLQLAFENDYECSSCEKDIILCSLLENGSNVNVTDEKNRTLLKKAIHYHRTFVVEKLLYYGADINIEDSFGNSALTPLYYWEGNLAYVKVFQIVYIHVQKLVALGHHICEKVQTCCIELRQRYQTVLSKTNDDINLDNIFNNCIEELNRMKLIKIDDYTSLYNILQKDEHELSKHVRNSTLVKILEDQNIDNNFPLYSYLLKLQFKKGLKRFGKSKGGDLNNIEPSAKLPKTCKM